MQLLLENNLSPSTVSTLRSLGVEAVHVRESGLLAADDQTILSEARDSGRILVTTDSDFPEMLALSGISAPSIIYLTGDYPSRPEPLALLLASLLRPIEKELDAGTVVALSGSRMRIRLLPIR